MDDRITLRFLVTPQDAPAGTVSGGTVLEWIDRAGYACAVGWSSSYCVTAYVGNVHFAHPIRSGQLIEVQARIIQTGRTSMQVLVTVGARDLAQSAFRLSMHCLLVFVAMDDGRPVEVPAWTPQTDADRMLHARAEERLAARHEIRAAMEAAEYTDAGTTPQTVLRFLAAPKDVNWGGNAHGGTVMRWIDEAAFACAAAWSTTDAVAVYSGGIHFTSPVHIGDLVEVSARLIHTGPHSMHIACHVRSGSPTAPHDLRRTVRCMTVFLDLDEERQPREVPRLVLRSDEDRRLDAHARELIAMRDRLPAIPL